MSDTKDAETDAEIDRLRSLLHRIAGSYEQECGCCIGTHRDCVIVHIQDGLWDNELAEFRTADKGA